MDDISRMEGLKGAQSLIDEILGVIIRKILRPDDTVHVCFHELLNQIYFFESLY